jgi:hypothetical protein
MPVNLEIIIRFESDIKIKVSNNKGEVFEQNSPNSPIKDTLKEVHFVKFEGVDHYFDGYEGQGENGRGVRPIDFGKELAVCEWTITDIDGALKGNPHI